MIQKHFDFDDNAKKKTSDGMESGRGGSEVGLGRYINSTNNLE